MGRAQWDVDRFVFPQQRYHLVDGHFGGTRHHHPVLGAVMVHLHRQPFARFNGDAFDLVAIALVDGVVFAPWTVNFAVNVVFMAAIGLNLLHHFFDVLHRVAIGNQHRVFGLHHHQIFDADGGHQPGFGINVAVLGFMADHIPVMDVAFRGLGADLPER